MVSPAPNLQNFILQKQVLASGDVASGCRVKRVANDGYSYFFAKKCTSKRGLAVIYPKLRRYHLVDLVVKHECEMVSVTHKFKPDRVIAPRNCNQQPRVVKIDLILCIKAWVCLALTITREHQIFCK